jgi:hypothetical protein
MNRREFLHKTLSLAALPAMPKSCPGDAFSTKPARLTIQLDQPGFPTYQNFLDLGGSLV